MTPHDVESLCLLCSLVCTNHSRVSSSIPRSSLPKRNSLQKNLEVINLKYPYIHSQGLRKKLNNLK